MLKISPADPSCASGTTNTCSLIFHADWTRAAIDVVPFVQQEVSHHQAFVDMLRNTVEVHSLAKHTACLFTPANLTAGTPPRLVLNTVSPISKRNAPKPSYSTLAQCLFVLRGDFYTPDQPITLLGETPEHTNSGVLPEITAIGPDGDYAQFTAASCTAGGELGCEIHFQFALRQITNGRALFIKTTLGIPNLSNDITCAVRGDIDGYNVSPTNVNIVDVTAANAVSGEVYKYYRILYTQTATIPTNNSKGLPLLMACTAQVVKANPPHFAIHPSTAIADFTDSTATNLPTILPNVIWEANDIAFDDGVQDWGFTVHAGQDCVLSTHSTCSLVVAFDREKFLAGPLSGFTPTPGGILGPLPASPQMSNGWLYGAGKNPADLLLEDSCPESFITRDDAHPSRLFGHLNAATWARADIIYRCVSYRKLFQAIGTAVLNLSGRTTYRNAHHQVNVTAIVQNTIGTPQSAVIWDRPFDVQFDAKTCDSAVRGTDPDSPYCKMIMLFPYQGNNIKFQFNALPTPNSLVGHHTCSSFLTYTAPATFTLRAAQEVNSFTVNSLEEQVPHDVLQHRYGGAYWCELWLPKFSTNTTREYNPMFLEFAHDVIADEYFTVKRGAFEVVTNAVPATNPTTALRQTVTRFDYISHFSVEYDMTSGCDDVEFEQCKINIKQTPFFDLPKLQPGDANYTNAYAALVRAGGIWTLPYNYIRDFHFHPNMMPQDMDNHFNHPDYRIEIDGLDPNNQQYYSWLSREDHVMIPRYLADQYVFVDNHPIDNTFPTPPPQQWWSQSGAEGSVYYYSCFNNSALDVNNQFARNDHMMNCADVLDYAYTPPSMDYRQLNMQYTSPSPADVFARTPKDPVFPYIVTVAMTHGNNPPEVLRIADPDAHNYLLFHFHFRKRYPTPNLVPAQFVFKGFNGLLFDDEWFIYDLNAGLDRVAVTTYPQLRYNPTFQCNFSPEQCSDPFQQECPMVLSTNPDADRMYYYQEFDTYGYFTEEGLPAVGFTLTMAFYEDGTWDSIAAYGMCPDEEWWGLLDIPTAGMNTYTYFEKNDITGEYEERVVSGRYCAAMAYDFTKEQLPVKRHSIPFMIYKRVDFRGLLRVTLYSHRTVGTPNSTGKYRGAENINIPNYWVEMDGEYTVNHPIDVIFRSSSLPSYVVFRYDALPQFQPNCEDTTSPTCDVKYEVRSTSSSDAQPLIKHYVPSNEYIYDNNLDALSFQCENLIAPNTVIPYHHLDPQMLPPDNTHTTVGYTITGVNLGNSTRLVCDPQVLVDMNNQTQIEDYCRWTSNFHRIDETQPIMCNLNLLKRHQSSKSRRSLPKRTHPDLLFGNDPARAAAYLFPLNWDVNYNYFDVPRIGYHIFRSVISPICTQQQNLASGSHHCVVALITAGNRDFLFPEHMDSVVTALFATNNPSAPQLTGHTVPLLQYEDQRPICPEGDAALNVVQDAVNNPRWDVPWTPQAAISHTFHCNPRLGHVTVVPHPDYPTDPTKYRMTMSLDQALRNREFTTYLHLNQSLTPQLTPDPTHPITEAYAAAPYDILLGNRGGLDNEHIGMTTPQINVGRFFDAYINSTTSYGTTHSRVDYAFGVDYEVEKVYIHTDLGISTSQQLTKEELVDPALITKYPCVTKKPTPSNGNDPHRVGGNDQSELLTVQEYMQVVKANHTDHAALAFALGVDILGYVQSVQGGADASWLNLTTPTRGKLCYIYFEVTHRFPTQAFQIQHDVYLANNAFNHRNRVVSEDGSYFGINTTRPYDFLPIQYYHTYPVYVNTPRIARDTPQQLVPAQRDNSFLFDANTHYTLADGAATVTNAGSFSFINTGNMLLVVALSLFMLL